MAAFPLSSQTIFPAPKSVPTWLPMISSPGDPSVPDFSFGDYEHGSSGPFPGGEAERSYDEVGGTGVNLLAKDLRVAGDGTQGHPVQGMTEPCYAAEEGVRRTPSFPSPGLPVQ